VAERQPRVGIGLAVRNGQETLAETVESLLSQDFEDFRLVISDNASTDSTVEMCQEFVRRDHRVVYIRQPQDLGPAGNFNAAQRAAGGEFFKWSAADDLYAPGYLKACVTALEDNPDAILAYPKTRIIGPDGGFLRDYDYEVDATSPRPSVRFRHYLNVDQRRHLGAEIFGLFRQEAFAVTGPKGAFARADHVFCATLTLLGKLHLIDEPLFLNRDHPGRSLRTTPSRTYEGHGFVVSKIGSGPIPADDWWDPNKKGKIVWPEWRLFREYSAAVDRAPLSAAERRACRVAISQVVARHAHKLGRDVLINAEFATRKALAER
jgi:glycosyltransferase involved in cell wall biosynthesis